MSNRSEYNEIPRLIGNARHYTFDPTLDAVADLIEQGPQAWAHVHPKLLDLASIHKGFRDQYRAAVEAGVIPDDRNANTYKENKS